MRTATNVAWALCIVVSTSAIALAQRPDFSGKWRLNEKLSQDPFEKIYLAMGTDQVRGAGSRAYDAVSSGALLRGADRAETRRALVDFAEVLSDVEIEQNDDEIKIWVGAGDEFFSLFYLDGQRHARQLPAGLRLEATAAWEGDAIRVVQVSESDAVLTQVFSRHGDDRLAFVFQLESDLSEAPVQFRVVYDRVPDE
jgi:hypothetical protein